MNTQHKIKIQAEQTGVYWPHGYELPVYENFAKCSCGWKVAVNNDWEYPLSRGNVKEFYEMVHRLERLETIVKQMGETVLALTGSSPTGD